MRTSCKHRVLARLSPMLVHQTKRHHYGCLKQLDFAHFGQYTCSLHLKSDLFDLRERYANRLQAQSACQAQSYAGPPNKKAPLWVPFCLVETTGLEPVTPCMSSKYSNQLSYASVIHIQYYTRLGALCQGVL